MKKLIVFASGGGSNFEALAKACQSGQIKADIGLLVASKPGIGAIEKAKKYNIPIFIEGAIGEISLKEACSGADLICLAGYLKKVPAEILKICPVLNIHPALLPGFGGKGMYGHHVHEAVLKSGAKETGATVHFVNENYDEGRVALQAKAPVLPGDTPQTLAARVLEVEHKLYPQAVKLFCEGKL